MNGNLVDRSRLHWVFLVYLLSLLWLSFSAMAAAIASERSFQNAAIVLLIAMGTAVVYSFLWRSYNFFSPGFIKPLKKEDRLDGLSLRNNILLHLLVIAYVCVVIVHFVFLGRIPILDALGSGSDIAVSVVRQSAYFDLPWYMRYASDYSLKAVGPALLLITYYYRSYLFWIITVVGSVYVLGMMARILPIFLFMPLFIYLLLRRRFYFGAGVFVLMVSLVLLLTTVSSVVLKDNVKESVAQLSSVEKDVAPPPGARPVVRELAEQDWRRTSVLYALYERALVVPGFVMEQWFHYYSDESLREEGCGYRLLAKFLNCDYVHIPAKLYAAYYPENVQQGMLGSLNASSFMTDFANFGFPGFLLSVMFSSVLFFLSALIYGEHSLALPMNLSLIISAMESNFFTALNSGSGWLIMTMIFVVFFRLKFK